MEYFGAVLIGCIGAVAIAVVVVKSDNGSGSSIVAEPPLVSRVSTYEAGQAQTIMYLVDSQERADQIAISEQEWLMSYLDNNVAPPSRTFSIIVAATPEEAVQAQQLALLASQELMQVGLPFEFIDLRSQ